MAWLINRLRLFYFKKVWRKYNTHNNTYPLNVFPMRAVEVGKYSYGGLNILTFGDGYKVYVGNFCSIGPNVLFILKAEHPIDRLSTFPFKVKVFGEAYEATSKGDIIIKDDVWIGANVTILSGITIGQGAVIAAGAVVDSNIPPYAIVGGVPAKVIKYRFPEIITNELVKVDFSLITEEFISNNIGLFYDKLSTANINELMKILPNKETI